MSTRSSQPQLALTLLAGVVWLSALPALALPPGAPRTDIRGITVSTHTSNRGWDSDEIGPTFSDVLEVGANWVAIHPYARISSDGEVFFRGPLETTPRPGYLERPIAEAHQRGLKILIKPHLSYWGSSFSWRGEIEFESEEQWQRFFTSYSDWIVRVAAASADADGFVLGTELDRTVHRPEWRTIVRRVRMATPAPLTYAANWTDYQRVPFWDDLDVVGVQAYFPISDAERPRDHDLAAGWRRRIAELRGFAERTNKKVLFTELGYSRTWRAASAPWEARTDEPEAEDLQRRCLEAALAAIDDEPAVIGAFLWKWFPRPRSVGRDFQLATPVIQQVIRERWGSAEAVQ